MSQVLQNASFGLSNPAKPEPKRDGLGFRRRVPQRFLSFRHVTMALRLHRLVHYCKGWTILSKIKKDTVNAPWIYPNRLARFVWPELPGPDRLDRKMAVADVEGLPMVTKYIQHRQNETGAS
uniref:Uncharacterized protein n=1 Tax=Candidatus Kentrum sp. LFY TaxID=2126342 RepID=A0A450V1S3_9GAMM|nr:MAG: hypothetical protein BECKLFY1418B_GA0070995_11275 [Candidatus Kentron sp. LFY]